MKTILYFSVFMLSSFVFGQRQLEYNQSLIITDALVTVPTDKVWKVTAIYGEEFRENECIDPTTGSSHEIGTKLKCAFTSNAYSLKFNYSISIFFINGTHIVSTITGFADGDTGLRYPSTDCTGSPLSYSSFQRNWSCINRDSDPNILPIWVPAGTTVQTGGPNTFLSVIEFNILN